VVAVRLIFAIFLLGSTAAVMAADLPARTVLDGVYTDAQMKRGRSSYNRHCRGCHLNDLQGGGVEPPLVSSLFLDAWREDFLASLYDFISTRMPKGRNAKPGSLKEAEYLDIVTYILARNGYAPGQRELTRSDLAAVLLVGPEGPAPLPPNAMMRTVGCFARSGEQWRLSQAAAPARVREGDETSPEEVAQSSVMPVADFGFQLNNLDQLGIDLPGQTGRRVQIKGVLNGVGETARIFVLSFADTGQRCPQA
jgi:mono/diheme cytochrome c family protein